MIPFVTFHGTGNDFVAIDAADAEAIPDLSALASAICDRETGLGATHDQFRTGADGILVLDSRSTAEPPRVRMRLYQPDGGTAAMCGNGARCVAAWMTRRDDVTDLVIETSAGDRPATVHREDGRPSAATIEMGTPSFAPEAVPIEREEPAVAVSVAGVEVTALTTGVPHAVHFVSEVEDVALDQFAESIRHASVFPEGANVTLAARADEPNSDGPPQFAQRTYERGVEGETRACGTGAVAILAAARRLGRVESETAVVWPPGGELRVTAPENGPAMLRGPVTATASGSLPAAPDRIDETSIEVVEP